MGKEGQVMVTYGDLEMTLGRMSVMWFMTAEC